MVLYLLLCSEVHNKMCMWLGEVFIVATCAYAVVKHYGRN